MSDSPTPPTPRRVGLRDIAKEAGVCLMTASLSLRNSPKISTKTRKRVRAVAARLGYRPDPEVARLMGRLRASRMLQRSVAIALIDLQLDPAPVDHPYNVSVRRGIANRADALGLASSVFRLRDYQGEAHKMIRVIRSRGITGAILLPSNQPVNLDRKIDWDGFSVVSATTSVITPRFHRAVPNQLFNIMTLIEEMHRRGYRRIGTVLSDSLEQRTAHYYSFALMWHGHGDRILILPNANTAVENDVQVKAWLRKFRPDLIFAQNTDLVVHLLKKKGAGSAEGTGLVSLSTRNDNAIAYQDELPEYVGACAVSLLTGMMHNNETGIPLHPQVTTIDGVFQEDRTVRPPVLL